VTLDNLGKAIAFGGAFHVWMITSGTINALRMLESDQDEQVAPGVALLAHCAHMARNAGPEAYNLHVEIVRAKRQEMKELP